MNASACCTPPGLLLMDETQPGSPDDVSAGHDHSSDRRSHHALIARYKAKSARTAM